MKKYFLILIILTFKAKVDASPANEILAAKAVISQMHGNGYADLLSVVEKWPHLGVLETYEDKDEAEKIRRFIEEICTDLANTSRELAFAGNVKDTLRQLDQLTELHGQMKKKSGYTNSVISSAIRITIRSGIFNILKNNPEHTNEAKKIIEKININKTENFNFKKWIGNAVAYDPWAKDHQNYINSLPQFPAILEVTFPLMKAKENIPNRISHAKLLDEVNSFQLGVYQYESEFFEVCVMPFWINYVMKEGSPKTNFLKENDEKYKTYLASVPAHPFFGSEVSVRVLQKFWIDSTGIEGVRQSAAAIKD